MAMAQHRGHETPMDFEFQNRTGPLDLRSPFAQVGQNPQRFSSSQTPSKKRPTSAFGSPSRNSPNKALPPVPAFNALYSTPRKLQNEMDDSSAGETPQSRAADSDATPDNAGPRGAPTISTLPKLDRPKSSPSKEKARPASSSSTSPRRESLFGKLKSRLYSPGRGEVPRADYSQAMEKRVRKRRDRELHRHVARRRRHSMSDSGGDDDSERPNGGRSSPRKTSQTKSAEDNRGGERQPSQIASFFAFLAQHPTIPHVLSFYAQLCFNVFLLAGCAWLLYGFWAAVQGDIDKKSDEAIAVVVADMLECERQYSQNRCDPAVRLPALGALCENWYKCMTRDASKVGRAKVSAQTFAEIFNSFVEPISYKAMIFSFILIFGCFAISNFAFGKLRDKTANTQFSQPYYGPHPPPTPQRSFSGQDGTGSYYGTPWHAQAISPHPGMEPQPSGGFAQIEGRSSPVRRLVYN